MISVEEIEPQEAAQEAAQEVVTAPEPEVIEEEPAPAEAEASVVDVEDVPPPLEPAPKKRGRPKAAPQEMNSAEAKRSPAEGGSSRAASRRERSATLRASAHGRAAS